MPEAVQTNLSFQINTFLPQSVPGNPFRDVTLPGLGTALPEQPPRLRKGLRLSQDSWGRTVTCPGDRGSSRGSVRRSRACHNVEDPPGLSLGASHLCPALPTLGPSLRW